MTSEVNNSPQVISATPSTIIRCEENFTNVSFLSGDKQFVLNISIEYEVVGSSEKIKVSLFSSVDQYQ